MYLIVDQKTTEKLIAARPMGTNISVSFVPDLVRLLAAYSTVENQEMGMDKQIYWRASLAELAAELQEQGYGIQNRHVGFAATNLGLEKIRRTEGYIIFWSREQLEILLDYFGIEGE